MQLKNECQGCKSYSDRELRGTCLAWNTPKLSNTTKCPCTVCLVKGVCIKACKEYKVYAGKVRKQYGAKDTGIPF